MTKRVGAEVTSTIPGMPQKPPVNPVTPDFFQNRLFNAFFGYSYRFSQNKTFLFNETFEASYNFLDIYNIL